MPQRPEEEAEFDRTDASIDETRHQLSETLDAIEDRLNPDHIKAQAREIVTETIQQAKEAVREATIGRAEETLDEAVRTTRGVGMTMLDTIKRNPVPAALIGVGVGWLLFNRQSTNDSNGRYDYRDYRGYRGSRATGLDRQGRLWMNDYDRYGEYDRTGATESGRGFTDRLQDTAGQAAGQAQDIAGRAADQAQDIAGRVADNVQQTVGGLPDTAMEFRDNAQERVRQTLQDSPLIAGGIALAAGMVVGLAVPETEREQQFLGEARDSLIEQVKETARGSVVEQLKDSAREIEKQVEQSIDKAGAAVDSAIS
jgi:ElaB/YqjD/DUF883 family membrane-anchored ribosome-binding protein